MKTVEFVAMMFRKVSWFNEQITGIVPPEQPTVPKATRVEWARTAMKEEIDEFVDACRENNVVDAADALIDLIYFALGRLHEMGVPPGPVFDEVHRCNMEKQRGELSKRPGAMGHDAVKPEGWKPPDHAYLNRSDILKALDSYYNTSPVLRRISDLRAKKGQDYNTGVKLTDYFPFGHQSYAQLVYMKALRLRSLIEVMMAGRKPNFEGLKDTLEDSINYSTFYLEYLDSMDAEQVANVTGTGAR
jgi:predicted HAD superfamily Cof-like phosphohydrolase